MIRKPRLAALVVADVVAGNIAELAQKLVGRDATYFQVAKDASLCVGVEALLGVGDAQLFETLHRLCVVEGDDDSSEIEDDVLNHI